MKHFKENAQMTSSKGNLLKIGDAAQILHVNPQTLRDWTDAGKIQVETSAGGHRYYYEADVKKLALAEKGITSYWMSNIIVAISANRDKNFYLNPETYEPDYKPQTSTIEFNKYWNFNNGLQLQPHMVALKSEAVILPPEETYAYPLSIPGHEVPLLASNAVVMALTEEDALKLSKEAVQQTIAHLENNYTAKQTVVWFDSKGREVTV